MRRKGKDAGRDQRRKRDREAGSNVQLGEENSLGIVMILTLARLNSAGRDSFRLK